VARIAKPLILLVLIYAASGVLMIRRDDLTFLGQSGFVYGALILVVSVWPLALMAIQWLRWSREQYFVTNRRVIQIEGVLHKNVFDSSLEKVNDVVLRQTLLGRLFNYGEIEIVTGSDAGINVLDRISHPLEFKKAMLDAKQTYAVEVSLQTQAYAVPQQGTSPQDVTAVIQQLAQLRDHGLISEDEFQTKKVQILTRL
jgi:uncharacterized membrane protein YdbT with pleckstrin-like domain